MGQIIRKGVTYCNGAGGGPGGASSWDDLEDKPFESVSADDFNIGDDKVLSLKTKGTNVDYASSLDEDEGQVVGILTIDEDSKEVRVPIPNVEITLEDYNKLSEEDKMKDIVYYIKDIPGTSSDISQSVALSVQGGEENTLRFGYDAEKEVYGYYPPGADTLVPFKSGNDFEDTYSVLYDSSRTDYIPAGVGYSSCNLDITDTACMPVVNGSYITSAGSWRPCITFFNVIKGKTLNITFKSQAEANTGVYTTIFIVSLYSSLKGMTDPYTTKKQNSTLLPSTNVLERKYFMNQIGIPAEYKDKTVTISMDISKYPYAYVNIVTSNVRTYIYKIWTEE